MSEARKEPYSLKSKHLIPIPILTFPTRGARTSLVHESTKLTYRSYVSTQEQPGPLTIFIIRNREH